MRFIYEKIILPTNACVNACLKASIPNISHLLEKIINSFQYNCSIIMLFGLTYHFLKYINLKLMDITKFHNNLLSLINELNTHF